MSQEKPIILSIEQVQNVMRNEQTCIIRPDKNRNFCEVGDILWVKETWVLMNVTPEGKIGKLNYYYKADVPDRRPEGWKCHYKSPMMMPRDGARNFLRVTNVQRKKLWDVTAEELARCGYHVSPDNIRQEFGIDIWNQLLSDADYRNCRWQANPFVWLIQFERVTNLKQVKGNYLIP